MEQEQMIDMEELPEFKQDKVEKKTKKEVENEKIKKVKDEAEEQMLKSLKSGKDELQVNSYIYKEMDSQIEMACLGISNGCFICGKGGLGKSYRTIQIANRLNVKYNIIRSKISPPSVYTFFWENRNKQVLIIDDPANFVSDATTLAILKSVLWAENDGERLASYQTQRVLKDAYGSPIPPSFPINFSLIILTNKLNEKNEDLQAVLTRIYKINVDIPRSEIFRIMEQIIQKPYEGLSMEERTEVLEFIKQNIPSGVSNLNLRTLIKGFQCKKYAKIKKSEIWKDLMLADMKIENLDAVIEELLNDNSFDTEKAPMEARCERFIELTGMARATFYRILKKIKPNLVLEDTA